MRPFQGVQYEKLYMVKGTFLRFRYPACTGVSLRQGACTMKSIRLYGEMDELED